MRLIDADALQKQLSRKKAEVCNARYTEGFNDALLRFKSMIHTAPTVQPQRMRGKWIPVGEVDDAGNRDYRCSQCGFGDCHVPTVEVNFCWNCGAEMEE